MQKANKGTFKKKDGSLRTMLFCEVQDLPKELIEERIKGNNISRRLSDGSKVVYDLEARDFRIFNQTTLVGEIEQVSLDTVFDGGYIF
jgi:predicted ATP-grasp superfamily ATP-dependent carboligase